MGNIDARTKLDVPACQKHTLYLFNDPHFFVDIFLRREEMSKCLLPEVTPLKCDNGRTIIYVSSTQKDTLNIKLS